MKFAKAWEEAGVEIPAPYSRRIKVLFAPDRQGVEEITFSHAIIPPMGRTDAHDHDRPELIYVVAGQGCVRARRPGDGADGGCGDVGAGGRDAPGD